ncbi:hypothetical protein [Nibrella viscosa]
MSVPQEAEALVTENPGAYAIVHPENILFEEKLLYFGMAGPRPRALIHGLRGRLATNCPHHASQNMAQNVLLGNLPQNLVLYYYETVTRQEALILESALINLYIQEFGVLPQENTQQPHIDFGEEYIAIYDEIRGLLG